VSLAEAHFFSFALWFEINKIARIIWLVP